MRKITMNNEFIVDTFGITVLSDRRAASMHNHPSGKITYTNTGETVPNPIQCDYDAFYEAAGGILALITKKKGSKRWSLSIVVSQVGQFPKRRRTSFSSWQEAWRYLKGHIGHA